MIILVINCGSSSIKYQLLDMKNDDVYSLLAKGIVEKIGLECGRLQHTPAGKEKVVKDLPVPDHTVGMQIVLDALIDKDHGVLKSFDDIEAVGHRIVQGADFFSGSAIVVQRVPITRRVMVPVSCSRFHMSLFFFRVSLYRKRENMVQVLSSCLRMRRNSRISSLL